MFRKFEKITSWCIALFTFRRTTEDSTEFHILFTLYTEPHAKQFMEIREKIYPRDKNDQPVHG